MSPKDLVRALLGAENAAARRGLLDPHDNDFYVCVVGLLKQEVDQERLRNPKAALKIAEIGMEVADVANTPRCRAVAAWAQGNVRIHLGDYAECQRLYEQAAQFFATEGTDIEAARLTSNQAFVLKNLGRYREGLEVAQAAVDILRKHRSPAFLASALNGLGVLQRLLGSYDEALAAFSECEELYATLGEEVRQARAIINKANVLENVDRFGEAIALLAQAREVLADHEQSLEVARADLNIGILHTRLSHYDEALEALARAEQGFSILDNVVDMAVVALYRADLYAKFNLYDELLQTSIRDWQVFEERQMRWQSTRATLHKAVAWRRLGDMAQAEDLLQKAMEAFERMGDSVWAHLVALERAALWCEIGEWARALPVAMQETAFLQERGMPVRAAGSSLLAAQCLLALGRLTKARERCEQVLELTQVLGVPSLLYRAHHGLGQVAAKQDRLQDAHAHFHQAVEMVERMRQGLQVEEFRLGFLEDKLQVYQDAVRLSLRLGHEEEAFGYVERVKSGALVDLLLASLSSSTTDDAPADRDIVARLKSLREELNWHYSKIEGDDKGERGESWLLHETEVWEHISATEQEMAETWRELQRCTSFYAARDSSDLHSPEAIQARLRPGEVLLQYYVSGETIHAFLVGQDGLRACLPLSCTVAQVADAVGALDATLKGVSRFEDDYVGGTLSPLCRRQLGWLHDDLVRPLLPVLTDAKRLLVAPDGILFEIPFHALYDGKGYLLERYEVSYTPSASTLWLCQDNHRRLTRGSSTPTTDPARWQVGTGAADAGEWCDVVPGQALVMGYSRGERLSYVRQEIEAVGRAIPGARVFGEEEATLTTLHEYAGQSPIVHLATHAIFRYDNPLFSALQLAGGDWLRMMDLYTLRLNGALVTLSACETGRHHLLGGDLLGLSRGFFYAGASALVVSLWPVDDVSTAILMERFYAHLLDGQTAASALQHAQLDLRNWGRRSDIQGPSSYDHPFYWAPFCLLGAPDVRLIRNKP